MYKWTIMALLFGMAVVNSACDKSLSEAEQLAVDKALLRAYIAEKGLVVDSTDSGLYYVTTLEGSGPNPNINSTVVVAYKGYFLNGEVFDESVPGAPVTFPLRNLILGWQEGIPLMKAGGRATLLLPSRLGYGTRGSSNIDPNTPIIFDISLVDFQ
jgi:FKBP-type peptidyl-prolyl cis-trans isomerase FkpA